MCLLSRFSKEIKKHVQIKVKKRRREEKVVFSPKPREEKEEERGGKEQRRSRMVVTVLLYSGSSEVHLLIKATVLYNSIQSFYSILLYSHFHSIITPCFTPFCPWHLCYSSLLSLHSVPFHSIYSVLFHLFLLHYILLMSYGQISDLYSIFRVLYSLRLMTSTLFHSCLILLNSLQVC